MRKTAVLPIDGIDTDEIPEIPDKFLGTLLLV